MPKLSMPGAVLVGDSGGMVDTMALKGVHHCIKSGMLAAESIYAALKRGETTSSPTSRRSRTPSVGKELWEVRNARQPFQKGFLLGGAAQSACSRSPPRASCPAGRCPGTATTRSRCSSASTKDVYPKPDGKYTFDKLSSVFITGNATRDDAPNHIRVQKHVPREIAETWRWMCPAGVYEIPEDAPEDGRRRRDRQLHQLRAVRRDHRQGRSPDDRPRAATAALSDHLSAARGTAGQRRCAVASVNLVRNRGVTRM